MNHTSAATKTIAAVIACFFCLLRAGAQSTNEPTSLFLTYKARPESRAAFREWLEKKEMLQLESWNKAGVFKSYRLIFGAYAAADFPDALLILGFDHFSDIGRWVEIERRMPGGLSDEALRLALPQSSIVADTLSEERSAAGDSDQTWFQVMGYDLPVDEATYTRFATGYPAKMFKIWTDEGSLSSYGIFLNQNPNGAAWGSLILLGWKDRTAFGNEAAVKEKSHNMLTGDKDWTNWGAHMKEYKKKKFIQFYELLARTP